MAGKKDETQIDQEATEASTLAGLAQLAGALSQEAMTAEQRDGLVNDILGRIQAAPAEIREALFKKPSVRDLVRVVMEQEPVAPAGAAPGSYTYRMLNGERVPWGHVDWSWHDLVNPDPPRTPMETKTFTPNETILLGWNGLFVTVHAEQEVTLPHVFYGIYMDHKKNEAAAREHAAFLMKKGPAPKDPTILTPDGMRSRSIANHDGQHNVYAPGAGNIPDWDPAWLTEDAPETAAAR